jgi:hypothetical protein
LGIRYLPRSARYVHVTSNIANLRGMLFGLGSVVLAVMWVIFIIQVLAQP